MENKAIIPIEEFHELRKNNPTEFWKKIWAMVFIEMVESNIGDHIERIRNDNRENMVQDLKTQGVVHRTFQLIKSKDFKSQFLWDLHFIAQKEEQLNVMPAIVCYLPFPGETYYTAFINANPIKSLITDFNKIDWSNIDNVLKYNPLELDIYSPHFWCQYADRAYRNPQETLPDGKKLPNKFVYTKFEEEDFFPIPFSKYNAKHIDTYMKLSHGFIDKYVGQNKVIDMRRELKNAMSHKEQEIDPEDKFGCLLWQGISFGRYVCEDKVFMHNTFVNYKKLHDDQWEAIRPYIANYWKHSSKAFPGQLVPFWKFDDKLVEECLIEKLKIQDIIETGEYMTKLEIIAGIETTIKPILPLLKVSISQFEKYMGESKVIKDMLNSVEIWFPTQKTIEKVVEEFRQWIPRK